MGIAVLFGGTSEERDVSIASAAQIIPALRALGHDVFAADTTTGRLPFADEQPLLSSGVAPGPPSDAPMRLVRGRAAAFSPGAFDIRSVDIVFLALHGPTADWMMAPVQATAVEETLGFPVVVKPSKQGSTVGLSVVRHGADLGSAIELAYAFDDEVMIEKFISGREFTVGGGHPIAGVCASSAPCLEVGRLQPNRFSTRHVRRILVLGGQFVTRHDCNQFAAASRDSGRHRLRRVIGANLPRSDSPALANAQYVTVTMMASL
jgi:D-alanine-D-alanine ligase-like ATP-grasp enzyme